MQTNLIYLKILKDTTSALSVFSASYIHAFIFQASARAKSSIANQFRFSLPELSLNLQMIGRHLKVAAVPKILFCPAGIKVIVFYSKAAGLII